MLVLISKNQKDLKILKYLIDFAYLIYIVLFGLAFWQINTINKKLDGYDQVIAQHELKVMEKNKVAKDLGKINKSLKLSRSIFSNKTISFRVLAQVASSVPKRVRFKSVEYNGSDLVIIEGEAYSDQDILKLIDNLNGKKLISQATLASMSLPNQQAGQIAMKAFRIACVLEKS